MTKVLVTGMSGTGKSTVLIELSKRGHRVVDTDYGGWCEDVALADGCGFEQLWREDRMSALLAEEFAGCLFVSGCVTNQGHFYDRFDAVVLLSVPPDVLLTRISERVTNDFGKYSGERARILEDLRTVEPLLRKTATAEIDAARPLEEVIDAVEAIAHGLRAGADRSNSEPRTPSVRDDGRVLALLDLDGTLVDRAAGFQVWAQALVKDDALGDEALAWLAPVFPGVLEALTRLRQQGWRLGVVTNGRVDTQLGKLRRSGVFDLLDGWCVSEETGIRKPDPRVFLRARGRCGAPAEDLCWVVGDDPDLDIAGGQASGMPTVWVSHGRVWATTSRPPDRTGHTPVQALNHLFGNQEE